MVETFACRDCDITFEHGLPVELLEAMRPEVAEMSLASAKDYLHNCGCNII